MNIPSERLFWSVVDAPGVQGGALSTGLWALIEDDLPMDPGLIWAVGTPIDGRRLLVCAALRSELSAIVAEDDVLTPDRVPEALATSVELSGLNLLVGPFEPVALRKARYRRCRFLAFASLFAAALTALGLERRTTLWLQEAKDSGVAVQSVVDSLSTSQGWSRDDLEMELLELRHVVPINVRTPTDAAIAVASLIRLWPTQIPAKAQSISVTGESAWVSVLVPGDAAAFLAALKAPEGWTLAEPRLAHVDSATRVQLELRRVEP